MVQTRAQAAREAAARDNPPQVPRSTPPPPPSPHQVPTPLSRGNPQTSSDTHDSEQAYPRRTPSSSSSSSSSSSPHHSEPADAPSPSDGPTSSISNPFDGHRAVAHWARTHRWPKKWLHSTMERVRALREPSRSRGRSGDSTTVLTPPGREQKSLPYQDPSYDLMLQHEGIFLKPSDQGINSKSQSWVEKLIKTNQAVPENSAFSDEAFETTLSNITSENEAKVIADIGRVMTPSAEALTAQGEKSLANLKETINRPWNRCIPIIKKAPQPDYAVGFREEAFTDAELDKMKPCLGDLVYKDKSFFLATDRMHFPFFMSEVKTGEGSLNTADRQNAHSATVAVRGIVELFSAVGRFDEINREILAFTVSHSDTDARIYGYYPVLEAQTVKYFRHRINKFDFTVLDGRDKWTCYRFTMNVYKEWMPHHLERIRSAVSLLKLSSEPAAKKSGVTEAIRAQRLAQTTNSAARSTRQRSKLSHVVTAEPDSPDERASDAEDADESGDGDPQPSTNLRRSQRVTGKGKGKAATDVRKGKAPVKGKGKATVKGKGKATVKGKGNATVKGKGKATVKGKGKAIRVASTEPDESEEEAGPSTRSKKRKRLA